MLRTPLTNPGLLDLPEDGAGERGQRAADRRDGVRDAEEEHRTHRGVTPSGLHAGGEDREVEAEQGRDPQHHEEQPDDDRQPGRRRVADPGEPPSGHEADRQEDEEEPRRHGGADEERPAQARPLAGRNATLDAEEVEEVGRQHHEAAGVDGGEHAGAEREGEVPVEREHQTASLSAISARSSSAVSAPWCSSTMRPEPSTNNVVGKIAMSSATEVRCSGSRRIS